MKVGLIIFPAMVLALVLFAAADGMRVSAYSADASQGNYPPLQVKPGEQKVLVLLVEFDDLKHTLLISSIRNELSAMKSYYYEESTYQIFLNVSLSSQWYSLRGIGNYTPGQPGSENSSFLAFVSEAVALADADVDFSSFDQIMIMHAGSSSSFGGLSFTLSGLDIQTNDNFSIGMVAVVAEMDTSPLLVHEYGHLLGLPDLYDYAKFWNGGNWSIYAGPWDPMSNDFRYGTIGFCSWNLIRLGWLPVGNVVSAAPNSNTTVALYELDSKTPGHFSAVRIHLADGTYYLAECRMPVGHDQLLEDYGVLVMRVNESVMPGNGPLRVVDSAPGTATLDDATFEIRAGKAPVFLDSGNDLALVVRKLDYYASGFGFTVEITGYQRGLEALNSASYILAVREQVKSVPYILDIFQVRDATQEAFNMYEAGDYIGALKQGEAALFMHQVDLAFRIFVIAAAALLVLLLVFFRKKLRNLYHSVNKRIDPLAYPDTKRAP